MRREILPLLALALALAALYNATTPLGEGPDEPGHLAYVLFLANERRLPTLAELPGEGHQPPLAYLLMVPAVAWLPAEERVITLSANPSFIWAGGDEPAAFARGSREHWPWQGLTLAWHLARAVSGLAAAATVALTALAARRLWPADAGLATLAALLVALNPQFLFSGALVTNDTLLAALGAALLWASAPAGRRAAPALRWAIGAGALLGLAIITKQSGLLFGPLLLYAAWRRAGGDWRRAAQLTLAWGGAALAVAGWWFLRNWQISGDIFGLAAFSAEFASQPFAWRDPAAWQGALSQLFASFWGRFGWMSLPAPGWATALYGLICTTATLGLLAGRPRGLAAPLVSLAMALLWTLSFALTAGLVAWQGRMLFPAIGAVGILLAAGVGQAGLALRGQRPAARMSGPPPTQIALVAALAALAIWVPVAVIGPAYPNRALDPATALAERGTPAEVRFAQRWERGVTLRGWQISGPARPGESLRLQLMWQSQEPIAEPWVVFVHLVASDETIVAESNGQPQGGALPFPRWTAGDWVADRHALALPAGLAPGRYGLRVGLYLPDAQGRRQGVWAADGALLGDYVDLGVVTVGAP